MTEAAVMKRESVFSGMGKKIWEGVKKYGPAALMMVWAVLPLIIPEVASAEVFDSLASGNGLDIKSDTSTMGKNIAIFLALVRWVCLAVGVGLFFVAGVKYMKEDNHQQGMGALPKAAIGLFVIAIGLSVVNYYIGTFNVE